MMIQQMLPPQKPLLLHIKITSEKFISGIHRSFQDIRQAHFGAKKPTLFLERRQCFFLNPTDRRDTDPGQ